MAIHHHPEPRPESCHQAFPDVVVDTTHAPKVQFGLDPGVGTVGVLPAGATGRAETPGHLGPGDPASGAGGEESVVCPGHVPRLGVVGPPVVDAVTRTWMTSIWQAEKPVPRPPKATVDANHFLSAYYPDTSYGGKRLFDDMVEQARAADRLGYRGVTLPEHHLINVLLTPSPLQMAVKISCETERLELVTSVAVLPLHDMRIFAGEVIQADILTDGRLVLGVGRGAFAYEMGRLGSPLEESKARFDESLDVLIALMTEEEVSWDGEYYRFEALTVMPRPMTLPMPRMMIAVMNPPGIAASTRRGFDIQTTPLAGRPELFRAQIAAHKEAKAEMGEAGRHLRIMMSRVIYCTQSEAQTRDMVRRAHDYYSRFDNVFTGPGIVHNGDVEPLTRTQTIRELEQNLIICQAEEMLDRLGEYAIAGIDEVILSSNLGQPQGDHLEGMERFASDVLPHLQQVSAAA